MNLLIAVFTLILVIVSLALVLLVLMQKSKSDAGMGAALGGGAAEATFGAETGNVLTSLTIKGAIAFFVLSLLLYLGHIAVRNSAEAEAGAALPTIEGEATSEAAMPDFAPAAQQAIENGAAAEVSTEAPATAEPQP